MLEIVFSQSAQGSMMAVPCFDPSGPAPQKHGFLTIVHRWNDVACISLGLSEGDIAEDLPGPARRKELRELFEVCGDFDAQEIAEDMIRKSAESLEIILRRSAEGEELRLWYSEEPEELCGFYWLMSHLDRQTCGPVSMVRMPRYMERADGVVIESQSWGELAPDEWHGYLSLTEPVSPALRRACAMHWERLRKENAPLRAVINGRLASAPETLYDFFIRAELDRADDEFFEASVIGNVLGRLQLGIGDGTVARRINAMIEAGELEIVPKHPKNGQGYRRMLRKKYIR